ncbi:MAG: bifunctional diguanylate cyclase/phosphodiesterase [Desulfovibrio sp.]|nr:bifunctional diguanylate cyclase/phosphodiesterase [Desulfovibrio sp.]
MSSSDSAHSFAPRGGEVRGEGAQGHEGTAGGVPAQQRGPASQQQPAFQVFNEDWFLRPYGSVFGQLDQRPGPVYWLGPLGAIPSQDSEMLHDTGWGESIVALLSLDVGGGLPDRHLPGGESEGLDSLTESVFTVADLAAVVLASGILLAAGYCVSNKTVTAKMQSARDCDALTGLNTLDKFKDECATHLEQHDRHSHAIIRFDISKFKIINDKFGFAVGDKLLRVCGDALHSSLTNSEICTRCFADQFAAFVCFDGLESLEQRVRQIVNTVEQWGAGSNLPCKIELHCGVYIVNGGQSAVHDIHQALDLADYALQEAKLHGKRQVVFYNESMRKVSLLHQDLKDSIGLALEKGELQVWFQPKVDMLTNAIIGSEALARWYHPTHGLLLPGAFIPLFEHSGDVLRVDFYIFEQVCRALQRWANSGVRVSTVSCNFSSLHFDRPEFSRKLVEIASRYSVPHGLLEVEITESTMLRNPEAANIQIKQLKGLGFRTTIDDFGSGYSSLGLLQLFAADVIKFDRSFVKRNLAGKRAQIVLGSMIELTKLLGMSAICEGIETEEQAQILMRQGCYNAQGYYYAKPMPADEIERLLKAGRVFPKSSGCPGGGTMKVAVGGLGAHGV